MKIIYGSVYTEDSGFEQKDINIQGMYIAPDNAVDKTQGKVNDSDEIIIDATDCYVIPGLTDIHFHGCAGVDFCDGSIEAIKEIVAYQASVGVTAIFPATMTLPEELLLKVCRAVAVYTGQQDRKAKDIQLLYKETGIIPAEVVSLKEAVLCGINLEGPFVSKEKLGAQNAAYLREPDQELFDRLQEESGGLIRMIDVAPELPGAMEFIQKNAGKTVVSLAHTAADYETAKAAFDAGATHVTHLFNAMNPFVHRQPGVIGAAADAGAYAELICDGVHVHPSAVRGALKLFGEDRIIFISDSMMATGLADGDYRLGGQPVKVVGRKAFLKDGTIAGSVTNLMECMRRAVLEMGIPLETAVKCAAVNPAKHMGLYEKYGSITPGKVANLVLLEKESLEVKRVIIRGMVL